MYPAGFAGFHDQIDVSISRADSHTGTYFGTGNFWYAILSAMWKKNFS